MIFILTSVLLCNVGGSWRLSNVLFQQGFRWASTLVRNASFCWSSIHQHFPRWMSSNQKLLDDHWKHWRRCTEAVDRERVDVDVRVLSTGGGSPAESTVGAESFLAGRKRLAGQNRQGIGHAVALVMYYGLGVRKGSLFEAERKKTISIAWLTRIAFKLIVRRC